MLADPAISEVPPCIMDPQGNSKGINNPSSTSISLYSTDLVKFSKVAFLLILLKKKKRKKIIRRNRRSYKLRGIRNIYLMTVIIRT